MAQDLTLPVALERLAKYRAHRARASQETFEAGMLVLDKNAVGQMGDERWAFLEQLALAALDIGRIDVADTCIDLLNTQFPTSPRVDCLKGIKLELTAGPAAALAFYTALLETDPTCAPIWKRLVAVHRADGRIDDAVAELHALLDTHYTDVEGWLELADIYESVGLQTAALQSLSHALLLAPQNSFYVLRSAETAERAGDLPLALKMHLLVIDMSTPDDTDPRTTSEPPSAVVMRAWVGVKSTSFRLLSEPKLASSSASKTSAPPPEKLRMLEGLALEELRSTNGRGEWMQQLTPEQQASVEEWCTAS